MFLCNAQHPHKTRRQSLPIEENLMYSTNTTLYCIALSSLAFCQVALVVRW
jgi:hypothetical protein